MILFNENEFAPFYANYIAKALLHNNIVEGLKQQHIEVVSFFKSIPDNKQEFQYAEGKWTPKDVLLHLIDAERIFTYRALRISRNDQTPLHGFEENDYVPNACANARKMDSLVKEFETVRNATISLFSSFTEVQLMRLGIASGSTVSVRAIGSIILGHERHHIEVIKERYL